MFINEFHGGLIKLGWVCCPNNVYKPQNLSLFVDNLFTYGSGYCELVEKPSIYEPFRHKNQRLHGIKELSLILLTLKTAKDEIKGL